jgi:hypothetical protein
MKKIKNSFEKLDLEDIEKIKKFLIKLGFLCCSNSSSPLLIYSKKNDKVIISNNKKK